MFHLGNRLTAIVCAVSAAAAFWSAPAAAQATRTWVSGVGDDANPCSRTAPCKTFAGAISKTATGGEINCLDPAGFGALTITKSISVICDNTTGSAGVLVANSNGIIVNAGTGSVVLSGLDFEGLGNANQSSPNGVRFISGSSLVVRNSKIHAFSGGYGIALQSTGNSSVLIDNVTLSDNGTAGNATSGGILVAPPSNVTIRVTTTDTRIVNNLGAGIRFDLASTTGAAITGTMSSSTVATNGSSGILIADGGTGGTINLAVVGTTVSGNALDGIAVRTTNSATTVAIASVVLSQNDNAGLRVKGDGSTTVLVRDTTITGNAIGVTAGGGQALSDGSNLLRSNAYDGAFSGTVPRS